MIVGDVFLNVRADGKDFPGELDRQVTPGVTGVAAKAAAIFAGAFVAKQVFDFAKTGLAAAQEAAKVSAQTEAVIKSTGGAANVTAGQIDALAGSISRKTGIEDDSIKSAQNLMLTFTNVQNRVGEGNDIFNRATMAMVDMGAAMGTDAKGSAIQLGKALNDPVAGISALTRVGVTFSEGQKNVIEDLVKTGDVAGAQKVILDELGKEFGGSAEAQATAAGKFKNAIGELQESVGRLLLPAIEGLARAAIPLVDWIDKLVQSFGSGSGVGKAFSKVVDGIKDSLAPVAAIAKQVFDILFRGDFKGGPFSEDSTIVDILFKVRDAFRQVFDILFKGDFKGGPFGEDSTIVDILFRVRDAFRQVFDFIKPLVGNFEALGKIIGIVALAFVPGGAMIGGIVLAYQHFEGFRNAVAATVAFVQEIWPQVSEAIGHVLVVVTTIIETFIDFAQALWRAWGVSLMNVIKAAWDFVVATISNELQFIQGLIRTVLALINGDWGAAWDGLKMMLGAVWDQMKEIVHLALIVIANVITGVGATIGQIWQGVWDHFRSAVGTAWDATVGSVISGVARVVDVVASLPGRIMAALGNLDDLLFDAGRNVIEGLIRGITSMIGKVGEAIGKVAKKVRDALPFSPAKEGPLSGSGSPDLAGAKIATMVAQGITSKRALVATSARDLAGIVAGTEFAANLGFAAQGATGATGGQSSAVAGGGGAGPTIVLNATYTDPDPMEWVQRAEFLAGAS